MKIVGIIPARYASTRFPGKPLATIQGKPMIQYVVEQCQKAKKLNKIIVATDDERIVDAVKRFGGNVLLTKQNHNNGTERCAEVLDLIDESVDYIINIQGDEPLIDPKLIDNLCELIMQKQPQLATAVRLLEKKDEIQSPDIVKCVRSKAGKALLFSRLPIPYKRDSSPTFQIQYYQHIGIYAYEREILREIVQLPVSDLEQAEQLEQLRWLEYGYHIYTIETNAATYAVDRPEDIAIIEEQMNG